MTDESGFDEFERVTSTAVPPGTTIMGALGYGAQVYEPVPKRRRWRLIATWHMLAVGAWHDPEYGTWFFAPLPCVLIEWDRQQPRRSYYRQRSWARRADRFADLAAHSQGPFSGLLFPALAAFARWRDRKFREERDG